jgi:hypothetical protein
VIIDQGIPQQWPGEVTTALQAFQQGDIVRNPPFVYFANPRYGIWSLTRSAEIQGDVEEDIFELDPVDGFRFGMIATETCDLIEEGRPHPMHPWLSIAPMYLAEGVDVAKLEKIVDGRYAYLRSVQDEALGSDIWIVDARILIPVEKSWLVGKDGLRVFNSPEDREYIATFFADRFRRADLSPELHTALIRPLRRWLEHLNQQKYQEILGHVEEVRLAVAGDPLNPDGAGLIIIVDDKSNVAYVSTRWDPKWDNWRQRTEQVSISLIANAYETYDTLSARAYRESIPVDINFN